MSTLNLRNILVVTCGALLHLLFLHIPVLIFLGIDALLWDLSHSLFLLYMILFFICDCSVAPLQIDVSKDRFIYREDPFLPQILGLIVLTIHLSSLFTYLINPQPVTILFSLAGLIITAFGLILRFIAINSLGDFFTTKLQVLKTQPLVTSGAYNKIRHPSYAGVLIITLGVTITLKSKLGFAIWLLFLLPLVVWRLYREERVMLKGFPGYREYMEKTKRLIPYIF